MSKQKLFQRLISDFEAVKSSEEILQQRIDALNESIVELHQNRDLAAAFSVGVVHGDFVYKLDFSKLTREPFVYSHMITSEVPSND